MMTTTKRKESLVLEMALTKLVRIQLRRHESSIEQVRSTTKKLHSRAEKKETDSWLLDPLESSSTLDALAPRSVMSLPEMPSPCQQ